MKVIFEFSYHNRFRSKQIVFNNLFKAMNKTMFTKKNSDTDSKNRFDKSKRFFYSITKSIKPKYILSKKHQTKKLIYENRKTILCYIIIIFL